jgi:hypothetical protein
MLSRARSFASSVVRILTEVTTCLVTRGSSIGYQPTEGATVVLQIVEFDQSAADFLGLTWVNGQKLRVMMGLYGI